MDGIKIFVIHNTKPLFNAIDIMFQNPNYRNHLEYWKEYLSQKKFKTVTMQDLYQNNRNLISIKIALEGNIVFMDTSKQNSSFRSGILFLPPNVSPIRKRIAARLTFSYNYLCILAEEKDINRTIKEPNMVLKLAKGKNFNRYETNS